MLKDRRIRSPSEAMCEESGLPQVSQNYSLVLPGHLFGKRSLVVVHEVWICDNHIGHLQFPAVRDGASSYGYIVRMLFVSEE